MKRFQTLCLQAIMREDIEDRPLLEFDVLLRMHTWICNLNQFNLQSTKAGIFDWVFYSLANETWQIVGRFVWFVQNPFGARRLIPCSSMQSLDAQFDLPCVLFSWAFFLPVGISWFCDILKANKLNCEDNELRMFRKKMARVMHHCHVTGLRQSC